MDFSTIFGRMLADLDMRKDPPLPASIDAETTYQRIEVAGREYGLEFELELSRIIAGMAYRERIMNVRKELRDQLGNWDLANVVVDSANKDQIRDVLCYHRNTAESLFDVLNIPPSVVQASLNRGRKPEPL